MERILQGTINDNALSRLTYLSDSQLHESFPVYTIKGLHIFIIIGMPLDPFKLLVNDIFICLFVCLFVVC